MRIAIFSILGIIFYLLIYRYVESLIIDYRLKKIINEEFRDEIFKEKLSRDEQNGYKYPPYVDPILAQKQMREMSEEFYRRTGIRPYDAQSYDTPKKEDPGIIVNIQHGSYYGPLQDFYRPPFGALGQIIGKNYMAHGFNASCTEPEESREKPREEKLVNPPIELAGPDNKGTE